VTYELSVGTSDGCNMLVSNTCILFFITDTDERIGIMLLFI
jgi:hypothetical protein